MLEPTLMVVSPHFDDAAFSLGLTLISLARLRWRLTIINCFTFSDYCPQGDRHDMASVSDLRAEEDQTFVSRLEGRASRLNAGFLDAPLRLKIPVQDVCRVPDDVDFVGPLAGALADFERCDLVLLPLGLGEHVDHRLARTAALQNFRDSAVGFYEDLPYASRLSSPEEEAAKILETCGVSCNPFVHSFTGGTSVKRELISSYSSQASAADLDGIAGYAERHGPGERLWLDEKAEILMRQSGLTLN